MKYHDYLKTFSQEDYCPFCNFDPKEIIAESTYFFIIASRAPYSPHHLLIVPKRHIVFLKELKKAELKELRTLTEQRNEKLHQHHKSVNILLRDTMYKQGTGKSINHLHLHLIPDRYVGIIKDEEREFMTEESYIKEVKNLKKLYR
jgi:diadenosine tetraphosphate (Ap4A) HIT family hydrolase